MTMKEIERLVRERTKLKKKEVVGVLDALVEVIGDAIENGDRVKLDGLGTFKVVKKNSRVIYKPTEDERCVIDERKAVKFIPYKALKERLHGK